MKKHLFPITLIILTLFIWLMAWPYLPDEIPSHWHTLGEESGDVPKIGRMLFDIGILLFIFIVLTLVTKIEPKKEVHEKFPRLYDFVKHVLLLFIFVMNMAALWSILK